MMDEKTIIKDQSGRIELRLWHCGDNMVMNLYDQQDRNFYARPNSFDLSLIATAIDKRRGVWREGRATIEILPWLDGVCIDAYDNAIAETHAGVKVYLTGIVADEAVGKMLDIANASRAQAIPPIKADQ